MGILDNYNPKIIKERWRRVSASPYASLKFQYQATKYAIIGLAIFTCYMLINVIINYDGGSNFMTMTVRGVMLIVMVVFIFKLWNTMTPLRRALAQYEQNPASMKSTGIKINVAAEVDEIMANIEKNKKNSKNTDKHL